MLGAVSGSARTLSTNNICDIDGDGLDVPSKHPIREISSMPNVRYESSALGPESSFHLTPGQSLGYLFRDVHRGFTRALLRRIKVRGITLGQWYFFRVLWEEDNLTQRELSERVGMMEPTTVTALRGMERGGLIRRIRDSQDRRRQRVQLTAKGRAIRAELLPLAAEVNRIASRGLTAREVQVLRRLAETLRENLAAEERESSERISGRRDGSERA
jgi:DNA-binding MarR family transcriptional regulator